MLPSVRQAQRWTAPHVCLACRRQLALAASQQTSIPRNDSLPSGSIVIDNRSSARISSPRIINHKAYRRSVRWASQVSAASEQPGSGGSNAAVHPSDEAPDAPSSKLFHATVASPSSTPTREAGDDELPTPKPTTRQKRRAKHRARKAAAKQQEAKAASDQSKPGSDGGAVQEVKTASVESKKAKRRRKKKVTDSQKPSTVKSVSAQTSTSADRNAPAKAAGQPVAKGIEDSNAGSAIRRVKTKAPIMKRLRLRRTMSKAVRSARRVRRINQSEKPGKSSTDQPTDVEKKSGPAKQSSKAKLDSVKRSDKSKKDHNAAKQSEVVNTASSSSTKQSKKAKKQPASAKQSKDAESAPGGAAAASTSDKASSERLTLDEVMKPGRTGGIRKISTRTKARQRPVGPNSVQNWTKGVTKHMEQIAATSLIGGQTAITPIDVVQPPVPRLAHQLDRVLFNPGIYHLKDPYTSVYSFDPYLEKVMPVEEFDFGALKQYRTSSEDNTLSNLARARGRKFVGSTSSMTSVLGQFHFLLSCFRPVNTSMLSRGFRPDSDRFTKIARAPQSIFLRWQDGTYAIDADKEFDTPNILMLLGKSMEKLLTMSKPEFERYRKSNPETVPEEERTAEEPFQYSESGDLLMRSQLDAYDPRLQRNGTFDLKTRTVLSIRMDHGSEESRGYEIMRLQGQYMSYEREYFDMLRATMLKYMLQVRIGRMEGIFVAYHNIERIFGFQYISLHEIDRALHGQGDTNLGDQEFGMSLHMLNDQLNRATAKFPEQSLRITFEATGMDDKAALLVFAEPMSEEDIEAVQHKAKKSAIDYENKVLRGELDVTTPKQKAVKEAASSAQPADTSVTSAIGVEQTGTPEISDRSGKEVEAVLDGGLEQYLHSSATASLHDDPGLQEAIAQLETPMDGGPPPAEKAAVSTDAEILHSTSEVAETDVEELPDPQTSSRPSAASRSDTDQHNRPVRSSEIATAEGDDAVSATAAEPVSRPEEAEQEPDSTQPLQPGEKASNAQKLGDTASKRSEETPDMPRKPLYAAVVTVQQFINQGPVVRPRSCRAGTEWKVDYQVWEYPEDKLERAWKSYEASRARRKKIFTAHAKGDDGDGPTKETVDYYIRKLRRLAEEGRKWRKKTEELNKDKPVQVWSQ